LQVGCQLNVSQSRQTLGLGRLVFSQPKSPPSGVIYLGYPFVVAYSNAWRTVRDHLAQSESVRKPFLASAREVRRRTANSKTPGSGQKVAAKKMSSPSWAIYRGYGDSIPPRY
jgi:hypothetical protein